MFINRNENGKVTALFANQQYQDQNWLDDNDPEVINFGKPTREEVVKQRLAQIDTESNSRRSYREAVINNLIPVNINEYNTLKALEDEATALRKELSYLTPRL